MTNLFLSDNCRVAGIGGGVHPASACEADVFEFTVPVVYSTVFDDCPWDEIARGRGPAEIHAALKERGITHIYVAWGEIERYRAPGGYGFSELVTREAFAALVNAGRLTPPERLPGQPGELYKVR